MTSRKNKKLKLTADIFAEKRLIAPDHLELHEKSEVLTRRRLLCCFPTNAATVEPRTEPAQKKLIH